MTPVSWSPQRGLDPTPDEARDWLEQELQGSDYQSSWLDSVIGWISDKVRALLEGADNLADSGVSLVVTVLVALAVIALLVWILPKVRREPVVAHEDRAVLEDLTITPRLYRDRAAQAFKDGRYDEAVLDGFRAIAKDMSDRTLLDDAPGRTAHEVSLALASPFPGHAERLARAADVFDSVRYGHRRATVDQASGVQQLDTELVRTRPVLAAFPLQDLPV
jgi:hypothetical protein